MRPKIVGVEKPLVDALNPKLMWAKPSQGKFAASFYARTGEMVISTDGIGTKAELAQALDRYDTIGIDLVAMNVNDVVCAGAQPTVMVDYVSISEDDPYILHAIGKGLAKGAKEAYIDIVGGEVAIMPGHFDLVGTCIGEVRKPLLRPESGDILIGLPSSGIHANGMTRAREILGDDERLLTPTTIYARAIVRLLMYCPVSGLANITGGGRDNILRMGRGFAITDELPRGIFEELGVHKDFNQGMGFAVATRPEHADKACELLNESHPGTQPVGKLI